MAEESKRKLLSEKVLLEERISRLEKKKIDEVIVLMFILKFVRRNVLSDDESIFFFYFLKYRLKLYRETLNKSSKLRGLECPNLKRS